MESLFNMEEIINKISVNVPLKEITKKINPDVLLQLLINKIKKSVK